MEAKELRIGNWIYSNTDKDIYRVDLIESWRNYLSISAIPLTEEWLLRVGFEKTESGNYSNEEGSFELIHNNVIGFRFAVEGQYAYPEIKYVHQLQNLYFALTGLELTYEQN